MADTILASLLGMVDEHSVGEVAGALGESKQSVSRGMQLAIPALLAGMVRKCDDPDAFRKVLDFAPAGSRDVSWSGIAKGLADPNSPLISGGKRLLSGLFGTSENAVTSAASAASGVKPTVMSTLLSMVAPMVMAFLSKRVGTEGISGVCSALQRETAAIRNALPAGLTDIIWPRAATVGAASPVVAQAVTAEKSSSRWPWALAILAAALGLIWLFSHMRRPTTAEIQPVPSGTASRLATETDIAKRKLPSDIDLKFDTGSSKLRPESQEQLNNMAATAAADPSCRMKVGGYTDNVGNADRNLQLSQRRVKTVVLALVSKGISPDRIKAEGYGEEYPIADNSTAAGRAQNRRVSVGIAQK
jgi:OOP family OmpA-OmpF porin